MAGEKRWPISKRGELVIGLNFERSCFDERSNFSEVFFKPYKKDTQVIRVQGASYELESRTRKTSNNYYIITCFSSSHQPL